MKMKRQIIVCVFVFLVSVLFVFVFVKTEKKEHLPGDDTEFEQVKTETENRNAVEIANEKDYKYTIVDDEGRLTVYIIKTKQIFLESAIETELLPAEIQEKLKTGIYFKNEKDMYDFLESYSS